MAEQTAIGREQCKDTAMAAVLIALLVGLFSDNPTYFGWAAVILFAGMLAPRLFYYPAVLWFGLAGLLSRIATPVVLTLIYVVAIVPVGVARRMLGKDSLQLRAYKQGEASAFRDRNHTYQASDLERPF